jgi:hypothetical protein
MKSKKGRGEMELFVVLGGVVLLGVVALGGLALILGPGIANSFGEGVGQGMGGSSGGSIGGSLIPTAAAQTISPIDAADSSIPVSGSMVASITDMNTGKSSTFSTFAQGASVNQLNTYTILVTNASHTYLPCKPETYIVAATSKGDIRQPTCNKAAAGSITVAKQLAPFTDLTNGTANYSVGSGDTERVTVSIIGQAFAAIQDPICIYEVSNKSSSDLASTQITGTTVNGILPLPRSYTSQTGGGAAFGTIAFSLNSIMDTNPVDIRISTPTVAGAAYDQSGEKKCVTCYGSIDFVDDGPGKTKGALLYGIENSGTTNKAYQTIQTCWWNT